MQFHLFLENGRIRDETTAPLWMQGSASVADLGTSVRLKMSTVILKRTGSAKRALRILSTDLVYKCNVDG